MRRIRPPLLAVALLSSTPPTMANMGGLPIEHTVEPMFSWTKGMTARCVHMLADRGLIDLEAPVARYCPEFENLGERDRPPGESFAIG